MSRKGIPQVFGISERRLLRPLKVGHLVGEREHQGAVLMKSLSCDKDVNEIKKIRFIGVAQDILETIGDGFCAVDRKWQIVHVNQRACEMWEMTPDSLIGHVFWEVFPEITGAD